MPRCFSLLALCLFSIATQANYYLVYFSDKGSQYLRDPHTFLSPESIERRSKAHIPINETDYPQEPNYLQSIRSISPILGQSKWLNLVLLDATANQLEMLKNLPFVREMVPYLPPSGVPLETNGPTDPNPECLQKTTMKLPQLDMIGATDLHRFGYTGAGIRIGIFDNGFSYLNDLDCTKRLNTGGQIKLTHDFVDGDDELFDAGGHGTAVMTQLAALDPGVLYGAAPDASYYLFRTENDGSETNQEEINWLMAAEWADSLGIQIISSSLGYNTFDSGQVSYNYAQMDGKTTIISKAAQLASDKGILVVNSAGNEGNNPWRYITAPGDADGVLTVGAVDMNRRKPLFSSVGPTPDGRIKPELVAMGSGNRSQWADGPRTIYGTSFSCPLISGLAACLWQANPNLTSFELKKYLIESGSQYTQPDTAIGYGIPNGVQVFERITGKTADTLGADFSTDYLHFSVFPNPAMTRSVFYVDNTEGRYNQLTLELWSFDGKKVSSWTIEPPRYPRTYSLDWAQQSLASGCYWLKIGNKGEWISVQKLILL